MRDSETPTASSTTRRVIRPGCGTHFVNAWISESRSAPWRAANSPAEAADEILGRAVMVGEVPGGEPGVVIGEHLLDRARRVDTAMRAGDLPHPVQDAADAEIGGQLEAASYGQRHFQPPVRYELHHICGGQPAYLFARRALDCLASAPAICDNKQAQFPVV